MKKATFSFSNTLNSLNSLIGVSISAGVAETVKEASAAAGSDTGYVFKFWVCFINVAQFRAEGRKCLCSRLGVVPCNCKEYDGRYASAGSTGVNTSFGTSGGHGHSSPSSTVDSSSSAAAQADTNDENTLDVSDIGDITNAEDQVDSAVTSKNQTCYNNPGWRENLIVNFKSIIIGKCSQKTKDLVDRNESIQVCFLVRKQI